MSWITPLGLPVIQPYKKTAVHTVKTLLQAFSLAADVDHLPVSIARQKSALPPNYVHSLDATHMLMTTLKMRDAGLTFAAVHDSYWTHPCDVDYMNVVLRETFVSLYEQPILEEFRASLCRRYPDLAFPPVPRTGDLDLEEVKKSKYFFH